MSVSNSTQHQLCSFLSLIKNKTFNDETLRILDSALFSRDSKYLTPEVRSRFRDVLRSESITALRDVAEKSVDRKLCLLEFFVHAFALLADIESCLALKYEALVFRETESAGHEWLRVLHSDWHEFAEQALDNGFYSIATIACENALTCLQKCDVADPEPHESFEKAHLIEEIEKLKVQALKFTASGSVRAQTAEYMRRKKAIKDELDSPVSRTQPVASTLFRNGIKRRYERRLQELRSQQKPIELHSWSVSQ